MIHADDGQPVFLIDGPTPFAPIDELIAWRDECLKMLSEYPGHPQWAGELASANEWIDARNEEA